LQPWQASAPVVEGLEPEVDLEGDQEGDMMSVTVGLSLLLGMLTLGVVNPISLVISVVLSC
jgi:hypothetical protein